MKARLLISTLAAIGLLLEFPITAGARELPNTAPALVGMSDERLDRLTHVVQAAIDEQQVAGAVVLILRRGEVAYFDAFGMADREAGREMRTDDLFRIASMTKAITSTAVMMLFEEGHFLLDEPIGNYLPSFDRDMQVISHLDDGYTLVPAKRPVTIRHLLTHTSGISYRFANLEPLSGFYAEAGITDGLEGEAVLLEDRVRALAQMPLAHQPGEAWTYGLSTDVLGRLVEVVSGKSLDVFFAERIFLPLDMVDTYFSVPRSKHSRLTAVYRSNEQGLERIGDGLVEDGPVILAVDYPYSGSARYLSGGAGLTSTARDYARFLQMLLNGGTLDGERLLSRKTVELMTSNQTAHLEESAYGADGFTLGFAYEGGPSSSGRIGSAGTYTWGGFFNTDFWVDPQEELVGILMTQHYPYGVELLPKFRVLVYQAIDD